MVWRLKEEVKDHLDPYQFAYQINRGTDDAILTVVHHVLKHLEDPKAYASLLFLDLNSAFNTVQPHLMLSKLNSMAVNPYSIKWFHAFLTDRIQQVKIKQSFSECRPISIGVPQGSVCSPLLFTLYTNYYKSHHPGNIDVTFSDDTAILGRLYKNEDLQRYTTEIADFVLWSKEHSLVINVSKTEEMIFDYRSVGNHSPIIINNEC